MRNTVTFFLNMAVDGGGLKLLVGIFVWLLFTFISGDSLQTDVDCLKAIKKSLQDPLKYLSSWNFNNNTEGFICKFTGVECWHQEENKVLNIHLSGMGLKGEFPIGIASCMEVTGVDLSNNNLYGSIPSNLSMILGFVVELDLSSNNFSGAIPKGLANCTYLNSLKLDDNQLSGQIPPELGLLGRIKTFSVTNNRLSGHVPTFNGNASVSADSYANNPSLCGTPLPDCEGPKSKSHSATIIGAATGGVAMGVLAFIFVMFFVFRRVSKKKKNDDPDGNKWAKSITGAKGIKLSMFGNNVSKMRLSDLMKATNSFSKDRIIGSGRTGPMYRAQLDDGTSLMVKRLQDTQHSEKEFMSEMATLGNVKHSNLVPLLGFCVAKRERLLIYQYMPNGSLHDSLHMVSEGRKPLDWALRLRIGIRAAKGFAWLHHNCNPRVIHRNISSGCILLDSGFEPKISEFGLARLMNPVDTHLSTFVNGEFGDLGYMAPEYARTLVATPKGDVYSFGVVLLELVTSEKPTYVSKAPKHCKGNLVDWITLLSSNSNLESAIDKKLVTKDNYNELYQFLKVACNCVLSTSKERPTMFEVYLLLRAIGELYSFTAEDEILMPPESVAADFIEELIVAR